MTKHPKRPRDPARLAKLIVDIATGEFEDRGLLLTSVAGIPCPHPAPLPVPPPFRERRREHRTSTAGRQYGPGTGWRRWCRRGWRTGTAGRHGRPARAPVSAG